MSRAENRARVGSKNQDTGILSRRLRRNSESQVLTVRGRSSWSSCGCNGIWARALASCNSVLFSSVYPGLWGRGFSVLGLAISLQQRDNTPMPFWHTGSQEITTATPWHVALANFHGINAPAMADFELPNSLTTGS